MRTGGLHTALPPFCSPPPHPLSRAPRGRLLLVLLVLVLVLVLELVLVVVVVGCVVQGGGAASFRSVSS